MSAYGTSSADDQIDGILRSEPPAPGATLEGWIAFAEWRKPSGETLLVLLGKPEHDMVRLKGYLHSGLLNMVWKTYGDPSSAGPPPP